MLGRVRLCISSERASVAKYGYVPGSTILVNLMMETLNYSATSANRRATRRNLPEGAILHSHRRENLKHYKYHYCAQMEQLQTSVRVM
jgi:hypothetical protein